MKIHESDAPVWEIQKNYSGNSRKKNSFLDEKNPKKKRKKKNFTSDLSNKNSSDLLSLSEYSNRSLESLPSFKDKNLQNKNLDKESSQKKEQLESSKEDKNLNKELVEERPSEIAVNGFTPTRLFEMQEDKAEEKDQSSIETSSQKESIYEKGLHKETIHFDRYA